MRKEYKQVRVELDTYLRLLEHGQRMYSRSEGQLEYDVSVITDAFTLDTIVRDLLDMRDDHARRSRESAARRKVGAS
jgi:hypothetical protein